MTVIALTSARGAPGVTTAALALTAVWPRPVLLRTSAIVARRGRGTWVSVPPRLDLE